MLDNCNDSSIIECTKYQLYMLVSILVRLNTEEIRIIQIREFSQLRGPMHFQHYSMPGSDVILIAGATRPLFESGCDACRFRQL